MQTEHTHVVSKQDPLSGNGRWRAGLPPHVHSCGSRGLTPEVLSLLLKRWPLPAGPAPRFGSPGSVAVPSQELVLHNRQTSRQAGGSRPGPGRAIRLPLWVPEPPWASPRDGSQRQQHLQPPPSCVPQGLHLTCWPPSPSSCHGQGHAAFASKPSFMADPSAEQSQQQQAYARSQGGQGRARVGQPAAPEQNRTRHQRAPQG